jgi:hypothetical protein
MTDGSTTTESLTWRLVQREGERIRVELKGEIDENAEFSELGRALRGARVELDLEGITRINSCGVREWVNFVRDLEVKRLTFDRCSPSVVGQINAIYNFRGDAEVRSFFAPYVCEACHADEYKLLEPAVHFPDRLRPSVPAFRCARCDGPLVFDELPERYFAFLVEPGAAEA